MRTHTRRNAGFYSVVFPDQSDAYSAGYRAGLAKAKRAHEAQARRSEQRRAQLEHLSNYAIVTVGTLACVAIVCFLTMIGCQ